MPKIIRNAAKHKIKRFFHVVLFGGWRQVPDLNGGEADTQDETWCLYDGEIVDDQLWLLYIEMLRVYGF